MAYLNGGEFQGNQPDAGYMLMSGMVSTLFAGLNNYALRKYPPSSGGGMSPLQMLFAVGTPSAAAIIGGTVKVRSQDNVNVAFGDAFFNSGMTILGWNLTALIGH